MVSKVRLEPHHASSEHLLFLEHSISPETKVFYLDLHLRTCGYIFTSGMKPTGDALCQYDQLVIGYLSDCAVVVNLPHQLVHAPSISRCGAFGGEDPKRLRLPETGDELDFHL